MPKNAYDNRTGLSRALAPFASLTFTVVLLALAMVLIFAGTTVQSEMGIWDVQRIYFHSWFTIIEWRLFFPLWEWGNKNMPGALPFPGGYTLIVLLLVNLLAAHALCFKLSWKRSGIILIHGGMILLLIGEIVTSEYASEGQMSIDVGGSSNYVYDVREIELAVVDPSPADHDEVVAIPGGRLARGGTVQHPGLPFSISVDAFYPNSDVVGPREPDAQTARRATAGIGTQIGIVPRPKASGTDTQSVDQPSAFVSLATNDGTQLGTYLVSTLTLFPQFPQIHEAQTVKVGDREYRIQLRFKREYKPYTVHLLNFDHDRYTGTDIPKNFSSRVRLVDPQRNVDREVLIWMNHPLRYAGETFYQASFKPGDQTSVLQVVRNPGWLIPYISCTLVGIGMLVHFGMHLIGFLSRVRRPAPVFAPVVAGKQNNAHPDIAEDNQREPSGGAVAVAAVVPREAVALRAVPLYAGIKPRASWVPAAIVSGLCLLYLLSLARPARQTSQFDLNGFARLPVSFEGRTMPLDSLARNSLRILSGKSELRTEQGKLPAINWLLDVFSKPERATGHKVFRIDHPDILSLLGLDESRKLFSIEEIAGGEKISKLQQQYSFALSVEPKKRDLYQRKIVELGEHIKLFNLLGGIDALYLSPPLAENEKDWRSFADAMAGVQSGAKRDPGAESFLALIQSYNQEQPLQFNEVLAGYRSALQTMLPQVSRKLDIEVLFNRTEPFIQTMGLYVIVFLLAAFSWLKWHGPLARAALWVLVIALVFHTLGLATRIYLQGRPPVTNLYSSAIFIAWAAVAFCVGLEIIYRNGVASAAASAVAFPSLLIAHYLAGDGDTMKMLQAVLDTNIWLATHVVVITLGYAATFLAGFIAKGYVLAGAFSHALDDAGTRKTFSRMVYGIVCFAMLFSFVGTILGGIWADQSWGRFWGWDPKENGAVLIVLWNAIILHARWGGLVKERGLMNLAIGGNIITAWSWFGTNMLGVGLHSYGFMDSALFWLVTFVGSQLAVIGMGCVPLPTRRLGVVGRA